MSLIDCVPILFRNVTVGTCRFCHIILWRRTERGFRICSKTDAGGSP